MAFNIPNMRFLRLVNFKSFQEASINLTPLTVIIGANASGKSNLLSALSFIRDLAEHGLDDAVSMQGGIDYLRNVGLPKSAPIRISFILDWPKDGLQRLSYFLRYIPKQFSSSTAAEILIFRNLIIHYDLSITALLKTRQPRVLTEELKLDFEVSIRNRRKPIKDDAPIWYRSSLKFSVANGRLEQSFETLAPYDADIRRYLEINAGFRIFDKTDVLLHQQIITVGLPALSEIANMRRYDIDPKLGKSALPVTGRAELEENGDNLPSALRALLNRPNDKKRFAQLLADVLPFIKSVDVASFSHTTRFLQVKETFNPRIQLPGYLLSDGTIDVIVFIISIYFQNAFLTMLEEPERNLHPAMIRQIANMMIEQSEFRQILATTHSPELIGAVGQESVQCIVRDKSGSSIIFRPTDRPKYAAFLELMGLGELASRGLFLSE